MAFAGAFTGLLLWAGSASAGGGTPPASNGDDFQVGPGASFFLDPDPEPEHSRSPKAGPWGQFGLWAQAWGGGKGAITMDLQGDMFEGLCSVHGPGGFVDWSNPEAQSSFFPYRQIQCGRAFGNDVTLDRCQVTVSFHAFTHSDLPGQAYLGSTTVDVRFRKTGATTGAMRVEIYTPKTVIELHGRVESPTPIILDTCPN